MMFGFRELSLAGSTYFPPNPLVNGIISGNGAGLTNSPNTNLTTKVYNVMSFGAVGNGVLLNGTKGASNSVVITNLNGNFTSALVGEYFHLKDGGRPNGNISSNLFGTIASVASSTVLSLSTPVLNPNLTNSPIIIGVDDTAAIQAAINTVCALGGTLYFPSNIYCLAGAIQDPGVYTAHHNSQLQLPNMPQLTGDYMPTFTMQGPPGSALVQFASSNLFSAYGATLWCMLADGSGGDGGAGSILNCANFVTPCYTFTQGTNVYHYNGVRVKMTDLSFRIPSNPNLIGLDLRCTPSIDLNKVYVGVGNDEYFSVQPTNYHSACVAMPAGNNAGQCYINDCFFEGAYWGLLIGEHAMVDATIYNCEWGLGWWDGYAHLGQRPSCVGVDIEGCHNACGINTGAYVPLDVWFSSENNSILTTHWGYPMSYVVSGMNGINNGVVSGHISYQWAGTNYLTNNNAPAVSITANILTGASLGYSGPIDQTTYTNGFGIGITSPIKSTQAVGSGGVAPFIATSADTNGGAFVYYQIIPPGTFGDAWSWCAGGSGNNGFAHETFFRDSNTGAIPFWIFDGGNGIGINTGLTNTSQQPYSGNGSGLTNTFNSGTNVGGITGNTYGVTNTSTNYGTAIIVSTAGTYSNMDTKGNWVYTNSSITGTEAFPVGPGAGIGSVTGGITTAKIIFQ